MIIPENSDHLLIVFLSVCDELQDLSIPRKTDKAKI